MVAGYLYSQTSCAIRATDGQWVVDSIERKIVSRFQFASCITQLGYIQINLTIRQVKWKYKVCILAEHCVIKVRCGV